MVQDRAITTALYIYIYTMVPIMIAHCSFVFGMSNPIGHLWTDRSAPFVWKLSVVGRST